MFKNSSKILFMLILMSGTMITISSNSWLGSWMGLEINLLSFIPLMNDTNNLMTTEASLKYFLTQAIASSILLASIVLSMLKINMIFQLNYHYVYMINLITLSTLLLKSGSAPFHFWFPGVMEGLSWNNNLILMTWQKIAPLMLISYFSMKMIFFIVIIFSVLIGSLGGLNQTSLKKLMAFSSINHLGWMIAAMISNESLWMMYFSIYSFLSMIMIYLFNNFKIFYFNQLFSVFSESKPMKFIMFFNLLSLGGLPPFLGFFPKWLVIQYLTFNNHMFIMSLMTMMTLITLFFYLRICYTAFMLNYYENNWFNQNNFNNFSMNFYLMISFLSLSGLIIMNLIYFLM